MPILTIAITAHWIDRHWNLHEALLSFKLLEGSHTGNKLETEIFETLDLFNITEQLFCIATDNASNNIKAMKKLSEMLLDIKGYNWDWEENHISCLNHVINLGVDAFLKKIKGLTSKSNILDEGDEEAEDNEESDDGDSGDDEDDEDDEDDNTQLPDSVLADFGKVLNKIHSIMKVHVCNIHLKRIDSGTFKMYVTIVSFSNLLLINRKQNLVRR